MVKALALTALVFSTSLMADMSTGDGGSLNDKIAACSGGLAGYANLRLDDQLGQIAVEGSLPEFAFPLFRVVTRDRPGETVLISPLSLSATLLGLRQGVSGKAAQELDDVLGVSNFIDPGKVAWGYRKLAVQNIFQGTQHASASRILKLPNARVNMETESLAETNFDLEVTLFGTQSGGTRLLQHDELTEMNAAPESSSVSVFQGSDYKATRLSIGGGELTLDCILPTGTMESLIASLDADFLHSLPLKLRPTGEKFPSRDFPTYFNVQSHSDVSRHLQTLGVSALFDRTGGGMASWLHPGASELGSQLFVETIESQNHIEFGNPHQVDSRTGRPAKFDRPYLMMVRDRAGVLLHLAAVYPSN